MQSRAKLHIWRHREISMTHAIYKEDGKISVYKHSFVLQMCQPLKQKNSFSLALARVAGSTVKYHEN